MAIVIFDLDEKSEQVLREAIECHAEGLKEAIGGATTDRTLSEPEQLTEATGSMTEDINVCNYLLGVINVSASH